MEEKFSLNLPEYPGFDQIVELPQQQVCIPAAVVTSAVTKPGSTVKASATEDNIHPTKNTKL